MLNRHFAPASYEAPAAEPLTDYAAEFAAQTDAEIAEAIAFEQGSALGDWGDDAETEACRAALYAEYRRRDLRVEVAAILDSREG